MLDKETAIRNAKHLREDTIRELGYLIEDLQKDYDRLVKASQNDDNGEGLSPIKGNSGFYLSQHCLRYEQTIKAGVRMEEYARLADWVDYKEKEGVA